MCCIYLCPCLDYGENFVRCQVCESEIVRWRESYNVAFSCDGVGAEEEV